jgi:hypothetical protein
MFFLGEKKPEKININEKNRIGTLFGAKYEIFNNKLYIDRSSATNGYPCDIFKFEDSWWLMIINDNSKPPGYTLDKYICDGIEGMEDYLDWISNKWNRLLL